MIYLDNAATTCVAPEVLDAMLPFFKDRYGNAGSLYRFGRSAGVAVRAARKQVADFLYCEPDEVIFTSGGSESNALAVRGLSERLFAEGRKHIVTSQIEHISLLRAVQSLIKSGFDITYVAPDKDGKVSVKAVENAIREDTGLVSVMYSNNETGTENEIALIDNLCASNGIVFHTDAVQAAGVFDMNTISGADMVSISSHKIHGPKGVGALCVRGGLKERLSPIIPGGANQEFGLRGGTENVTGIVGLGAACELAMKDYEKTILSVTECKQDFYDSLLSTVSVGGKQPCVYVNGASPVAHNKTLNLRIDGIEGDSLVLLADSKGVCISAGSACHAKEAKPSHVLTAMGLTPEQARSSIRVSFSKYSTREESVEAGQIIGGCINLLRGCAF